MIDLWVEERIHKFNDIQTWEDFTPDEFQKWCNNILSTVSKKSFENYKNIKIKISSTIEPYDDYPGNVEVELFGEREKTGYEIKVDQQWEEAGKLAKKLGVCTRDALTIMKLEEQKKVKISNE